MTARTRRSFSSRSRIPWLAVCVAGTLLGLGSCAPRSEYWSNAEAPKQLRVDRAEFHHLVPFDGRSATPSAAGLKNLDAFLGRQAGERGIEAWVSGGDTLLDVRRQASVLSHLRKYGLNARLETAPVSGQPGPGAVRVTLVRHVVTAPNCGDWTKDATTDRTNQPSSNFGCATAHNLGAMVADPGVLVRGTDIGPGDGDMLSRGVRKYREGKKQQLPKVTPLVIQATSGSGGGE